MSASVEPHGAPTPTTVDRSHLAERMLAFRLGEEEFATDLRRVREILALPPITPLPFPPAGVRGVMNLRGRIVPVHSLRACLGLSDVTDTAQSCVIVVDLPAESAGTRAGAGVLVDAVIEVIDTGEASVAPPPIPRGASAPASIHGVILLRGRMLTIIDLAAAVAPIQGKARAA